jgi:hypothetical protein
MRNLKAVIILLLVVQVIVSCSKGNEHLSRDLLTPLIPVSFEVPANTGIIKGEKLTEFSHQMNLDSLIKASAGSSFGTESIKSIKLTSMRLDVLNFDTIYNFRLIDSLQVVLRNGSETSPLLAQVISNPDVNMETLILPLASQQPELTSFTNNGTFKYLLSGHIRRNTSRPLRATLTAQYKITIGQ